MRNGAVHVRPDDYIDVRKEAVSQAVELLVVTAGGRTVLHPGGLDRHFDLSPSRNPM